MVEECDVHKNGTRGVTLGKDMVANETIGDGCNQVGTGPKSVLGEEKRTFSECSSLRYIEPDPLGTTTSHWSLSYPVVTVFVPCCFHVADSSALKVKADIPPEHW